MDSFFIYPRFRFIRQKSFFDNILFSHEDPWTGHRHCGQSSDVVENTYLCGGEIEQWFWCCYFLVVLIFLILLFLGKTIKHSHPVAMELSIVDNPSDVDRLAVVADAFCCKKIMISTCLFRSKSKHKWSWFVRLFEVKAHISTYNFGIDKTDQGILRGWNRRAQGAVQWRGTSLK